MIKRTLFAGLLGAVAAVSTAPSPALARPFPVYASTTPILYRYAACLYDGSAPTVEAQVEQCAALKAELTAEGEAVIQRFHVVERYDVERNLRRAFREMELDLKKISSQGKFVPQAMVGYWKCMGEAAMVTQDYLAADAVSYLGIEEPCFEATIAPAREVISDSESTSLTLLYRRFRRNGRLTFPAARQTAQNGPAGTRLQFVETLDPGFLVPGQLTQIDNEGARE